MIPSILPKQKIVVDRSYFKNSQPSRGEVILFKNPKNGTTFVGRVIGLPDDRIHMNVDKQILVNKVQLKRTEIGNVESVGLRNEKVEAMKYLEESGNEQYYIVLNEGYAGRNSIYDIPTNNYFILGDNRDN